MVETIGRHGLAVFGPLAASVADAAATASVAPVPSGRDLFPWGGLAALLGLIVGGAELVARYRDEPKRALSSSHGLAYLSLNMVASVGVFVLMVRAHATFFSQLSIEWLTLLSGFGAMAVLRSKVFTFHTKANEEVPIGPDGIVKAYLEWADRGVDRRQSESRWATTYSMLRDIPDEAVFSHLLGFLGTNLRSYQNLSADELRDFDETIKALRGETTLPVGLRAVAAGLAFQELAGESNFGEVVRGFRQVAGLPPATPRSDRTA